MPPSNPRRPDPSTTCARGSDPPPSTTEPLAPPIQLSAVYRVAGLDEIDALYRGEAAGSIYARDGHPNAAQLAAKVAALEGAEAGLVLRLGHGGGGRGVPLVPRTGRRDRRL